MQEAGERPESAPSHPPPKGEGRRKLFSPLRHLFAWFSALGHFLLFQYRLRKIEDDQSDDQEIDQGAEERTEEEMKRSDIERGGPPGAPRKEERNNRHENPVDHCAHEKVELSADNDGDCKTHDAVFLQKMHKFLQHNVLLKKVMKMRELGSAGIYPPKLRKSKHQTRLHQLQSAA